MVNILKKWYVIDNNWKNWDFMKIVNKNHSVELWMQNREIDSNKLCKIWDTANCFDMIFWCSTQRYKKIQTFQLINLFTRSQLFSVRTIVYFQFDILKSSNFHACRVNDVYLNHEYLADCESKMTEWACKLFIIKLT